MKALAWAIAAAALAALLLAACDSPEPTATASPAPVSRVAISSGHSHSCALDEDGRAACWGDNAHGQATAPTDERFTAISSGWDHSCGLREDGQAICWGDNEHGKATPPTDEQFAAISGLCGLRDDGTSVCWGGSALERVNPGVLSFPAVAPLPDERFITISGRSGRDFGCGLRQNGTAVCWDEGVFQNQREPPADERFTAISLGGWHACALRRDGTPICWGNNEHGQAAVPPGERFTAISGGGWHTCALREDSTPVCWGDNRHGQTNPPDGERFVAISSGWWHTCAVREDGTPLCWGSDSHGQATIWGSVWRLERWDLGPSLGISGTAAKGRADAATLYVHCDETLRVAGVWIAFTIDAGSTPGAQGANETLDEVYISRRASGTPGRWVKTGWDHYVSTNQRFMLRTKPAAAFIAQLTEVEEMAVLAKHDYGPDTAAIFDVRYLSAALASSEVDWRC